MTENKRVVRSFGLLISTNDRHGYPHIEARLMCREDEAPHPINCRSDGESSWENDKPHIGRFYNGLGMYGFISGSNPKTPDDVSYIGYSAEYRDVCAGTEKALTAMLATLRRVNKTVAKESAHEPGDYFAAMFRALNLSWVCEVSGKERGSMYSDSEWRFMSMGEGRRRFREMIETGRREMMERHGIKAAA
jgi:hypothetical protein